MSKAQAGKGKWAMRALTGMMFILGAFALVLNFSSGAEANGIQKVIITSGPFAHPQLFVASPEHDSTVATNVVHYSARYTWLSCGNEPMVATLRVYEHIAGGKVSSAKLIDHKSDWRLLDAKSIALPKFCLSFTCMVPYQLTLNGTFTLSSLKACESTTLWTLGNNEAYIFPWLIYDFTWLNRSGCTTPTPIPPTPIPPTPHPPTPHPPTPIPPTPVPPTPTVVPTPTPTPTPTPIILTCSDGQTIIVGQNTNVNCNTNTNNNNIVLNVDNSSNNSSSNSSSSESKSNTGDVKVTQVNTQTQTAVKGSGQVAGAVAYAAPTSAPQAVPVTAKTGAEGVATLLFSTLFGGSGLTYIVRKTILG